MINRSTSKALANEDGSMYYHLAQIEKKGAFRRCLSQFYQFITL